MQTATKISIVTLLVAVAALVIGLWPVVADAPWEGSVSQEKRFDGDLARTFANRGFERHAKGVSAENWDLVWESIEDYDRAIELDPYYALAFHNRGAAYWNLGRTQLAIRDYSKAIEADATVAYLQIASVYANRSYAYFSIGELEKKQADLATACSFDSQYCEGPLDPDSESFWEEWERKYGMPPRPPVKRPDKTTKD